MPVDRRDALKADCSQCFGLCCVALPFAKTADFAIDKGFAEPCPNLGEDFSCQIHARLRERGFRGCTVYECFGAGQRTSQVSFDGVSWRENREIAIPMFEVYSVQRVLHELLWYLAEALDRPAAAEIGGALQAAFDETERLTGLPPEDLLALDIEAHREPLADLLREASEIVREDAIASFRRDRVRGGKKPGRGPDFIGADLRGADLRGADLRGAYLIAANLSRADLRAADVIGADLRDADLSGADLTDSLFLTQTQLNAAKGDGSTKLPATLDRPGHWR
ncbi:MAG: pentapeptide repeat-containing protein [Solirubrobacteraceae bacterium]|nr:pentapeptide repeat-containing protein [Solirubrobacteraceae bacterium]